MKVTAKLFSMFRLYAGVDQADVELPEGATTADLLDALAGRFENPVFDIENPLLMMMVNHQNAAPDTPLSDGDTVHLLPVLGGG